MLQTHAWHAAHAPRAFALELEIRLTMITMEPITVVTVADQQVEAYVENVHVDHAAVEEAVEDTEEGAVEAAAVVAAAVAVVVAVAAVAAAEEVVAVDAVEAVVAAAVAVEVAVGEVVAAAVAQKTSSAKMSTHELSTNNNLLSNI